MKQNFLSIAVFMSVLACSTQAQGRRVPCSAEQVNTIKNGLSKLKQVDGDLTLLARTPVSAGANSESMANGEIETASGEQFKVKFDGIYITGTCFDFVIPTTNVQGKFYLNQEPDGNYTLVHWEGKYPVEPKIDSK